LQHGLKLSPPNRLGSYLQNSRLLKELESCGHNPRARTIAILLLALTLVWPAALSAQQPTPDASTLRTLLQTSMGNLPWGPFAGYQLTGQFVFKGVPEETRYQAIYACIGDRRLADFSQEDRTRNMRYGAAGQNAWASSPEITADIDPSQVPFTVQFDFPLLFAELLRILGEAQRAPSFRLERNGNDIYVRGTLRGGQVATFFFNTVEYFPRKVSITSSTSQVSAWLFTTTKPDGSVSFIRLPEPSSNYEVWFSDPADMGSYRYPLRTDYAQHGDVVATFMHEKGETISELPAFWNRPAKMPWAESLSYSPPSAVARPSLYLKEAEIPSFRSRLSQPPWSEWKRTNSLAAAWASCVLWIGPIFHSPPSLKLVAIGIGIALLGFTVLVARRIRLYKQRVSWVWLVTLVAGGLFVLAAAIASRHLHSAESRALLGLHTSIRYAITQKPATLKRAERYLRNLSEDSPAFSLEELGKACQAHAVALDLIKPGLGPAEQKDLYRTLFEYARPLYGALQGWRSNTEEGIVAAAGLGMAGLAVGCEPYVKTARDTLEKSLKSQLVAGLHRAGPGPGVLALDSAANLFAALKKNGEADYFKHPAFQQYVRTTLQLLSPLGTLPLFGNTSLDDADRCIALLLKVANHMPQEIGRQCISAGNHYWTVGRYTAKGMRKLALHFAQPHAFFISNPYVLFLYEKTLPEGTTPVGSAVLGDGQAAVLRSGSDTDSIYLALNAAGWGWDSSHRDILTFDLYAYRGLLLHGAGYPGKASPLYPASVETAAGNSITLNHEGQSGTRCTGISTSLLNQPLFDLVRALADKTYDYGQVQRDVVMVRPDKDHSGYFVMIDEVLTTSSDTKVEWYLHGRGSLSTSVDRISRWRCLSFFPPQWRTNEVTLAAFPLGSYERLRSAPGILYSQSSLLDQRSEMLVLEWTGSKRLCTILFPAKSGFREPAMQILDPEYSARIGDSDWVSLSEPETRRTAGPLTHISEYAIMRKRGESFPAILMLFGLEFRSGSHSVVSTKPVTISLDGLRGGILNTRPDTHLEFHSPQIKSGDRFLLDGERVFAREDGMLSLALSRTGEHNFGRAN